MNAVAESLNVLPKTEKKECRAGGTTLRILVFGAVFVVLSGCSGLRQVYRVVTESYIILPEETSSASLVNAMSARDDSRGGPCCRPLISIRKKETVLHKSSGIRAESQREVHPQLYALRVKEAVSGEGKGNASHDRRPGSPTRAPQKKTLKNSNQS